MNGHRLPLLLLIAAGHAANADPLAGAAMTIYEADGPRSITFDAPTMTVFSGSETHQVEIASDWGHAAENGFVKLSTGYRHDRTSFDIAADASGRATPNILSELTWQLPSAEIRIDGEWTHDSGFTVKGHLAYAQAFSGGEVQDSDYLSNDRQAEFSRSYSDPRGSTSHDLSLGVGWRIPLGERESLTPMVGMARYRGDYRMRDGRQVISAYGFGMPLGAFDGLDSSYSPRWRSGWIGIDGAFRAGDQVTINTALKQHWFSYEAEANWNLRNSFAHPVSFRHSGYGSGWEAEINSAWTIQPRHRLSFDVSARDLRLKDGRDITYLADGSSVETQLNSVLSETWSARLGYRFDY